METVSTNYKWKETDPHPVHVDLHLSWGSGTLTATVWGTYMIRDFEVGTDLMPVRMMHLADTIRANAERNPLTVIAEWQKANLPQVVEEI